LITWLVFQAIGSIWNHGNS